MSMEKLYSGFIVMIVISLLITGCTSGAPGIEETNSMLPEVTNTQTPIPVPSLTPQPLAATVNGEGILLEDYEAELQRLQDAQTETGVQLTAEEQNQMVLDELIARSLLAQAAARNGFVIDDAALQEEMDKLASDAGGSEALTTWMNDNHYNDESLRRSVRLSNMAAWQRDQITTTVPQNAEQIHARQILVQDRQEAESILRQIQQGVSFDDLATAYDPLTGGELGWFPRGYLFLPEVEEAAFNLQPGETSQIIESSYGFHMIQVIERDPQHPLTEDAWQTLAHQAVQSWVLEQRQSADIQLFIP